MKRADRWERASLLTQFGWALGVARRRGRELRTRYPSVIAVGAGRRFRAGKTIVGEVCLRFLVRRKRKTPHRFDVPQKLVAYVRVGGKRRRIAIPTDVSEFVNGRPHVELAAGIETREGGTPLELGAACCLVTDGLVPPTRYLLTCYHVFSPAMQAVGDDLACVDCATKNPIGSMAASTTVGAPGDPVDAALVAVGGGFTKLTLWGHVIPSKATDYDLHLLVNGTSLELYARINVPRSVGTVPPRTGPLTAIFQGVIPSLECNYPDAGRDFTFQDVIEYTADAYPGDSGAALADTAGKLYGMHFYATNDFAYALSAPRLFDPGIFTIGIALA
jgi:Trypsin-like peptidase domain